MERQKASYMNYPDVLRSLKHQLGKIQHLEMRIFQGLVIICHEYLDFTEEFEKTDYKKAQKKHS